MPAGPCIARFKIQHMAHGKRSSCPLTPPCQPAAAPALALRAVALARCTLLLCWACLFPCLWRLQRGMRACHG